mgnify:CR=1 FL=1
MTSYKYGDIKISVTCDMTRDDEMEAAIAYMNAAKERLRAVKSNVVPKIEAVGEVRFVAIISQLHSLADIMKSAGIDSAIYTQFNVGEQVRFGPNGTFYWYPEFNTSFYACNINSPMEALKNSDVFQMGIGSNGIITLWNEKQVYERLRCTLLNKINVRAKEAAERADHILAQYAAVTGGAK